ncbi:MAG: hypothetical protein ACRDQU_10410 [Pseudonocardiaceae bacterium]
MATWRAFRRRGTRVDQPSQLRNDLAPALLAFAEAAGEIPSNRSWSLGWTTKHPGVSGKA